MRYYFVYKTTNKKNGKYYIGVHGTNSLDDGYLGSGKYLADAIIYYGVECFEREILSFHSSYDEALAKEIELVGPEQVNDDNCYNLVWGGGKPPLMCGKDHPMFGKKRPDSSRRMKEKNPSKGKCGKLSHTFNTVVVFDPITKQNTRVSLQDVRYINRELRSINVGMATVRDGRGNVFQISVDDPRYLEGFLVPVAKGTKRRWTVRDIDVLYNSRRGRKWSEKERENHVGKHRAWNKGKTLPQLSLKTKVKMSKAMCGRKKKLVECPVCHKMGGLPAMIRWHFNSCGKR